MAMDTVYNHVRTSKTGAKVFVDTANSRLDGLDDAYWGVELFILYQAVYGYAGWAGGLTFGNIRESTTMHFTDG